MVWSRMAHLKGTFKEEKLCILENTTLHNGKRYDVGMLFAEYNIQLLKNFSALVQFKSLEKWLKKTSI